jgi:hypothetical protein
LLQWAFARVAIAGAAAVGLHVTRCWAFQFLQLAVRDCPVAVVVEMSQSLSLLHSTLAVRGSDAAIVTDGSCIVLEDVVATATAGAPTLLSWNHSSGLGGHLAALPRGRIWYQGRAFAGGRALPPRGLLAVPAWRAGRALASIPRPTFDGPADPLNAVALGARGDWATDDTRALQAAIDAAGARPLFLPFGNYRVTETLRWR